MVQDLVSDVLIWSPICRDLGALVSQSYLSSHLLAFQLSLISNLGISLFILAFLIRNVWTVSFKLEHLHVVIRV